jgi:hypothetical protein
MLLTVMSLNNASTARQPNDMQSSTQYQYQSFFGDDKGGAPVSSQAPCGLPPSIIPQPAHDILCPSNPCLIAPALSFPPPLNSPPQTPPPRRESLARATALYLERKATSEAGTPLLLSEVSTPAGNNSTSTANRPSPFRSSSSTALPHTAPVGIRSLQGLQSLGAKSQAAGGVGIAGALSAVPEQAAVLTANSPPGRKLFKSATDGGCSPVHMPHTAAEPPASSAPAAAADGDAEERCAGGSSSSPRSSEVAGIGGDLTPSAAAVPSVTADTAAAGECSASDAAGAAGAAAGPVSQAAAAAAAAWQTPPKAPEQQQQLLQEEQQQPQPQTEPPKSRIRGFLSRRSSSRDNHPQSQQQQPQQQSPVSNRRLALFHSPQHSRNARTNRRDSEPDSSSNSRGGRSIGSTSMTVRGLAAGFDAAAGAAAAAAGRSPRTSGGGVRGYRAASEAGAAAGGRAAGGGGGAGNRSSRSGSGKWQQQQQAGLFGLSPESSTGTLSKSEWD